MSNEESSTKDDGHAEGVLEKPLAGEGNEQAEPETKECQTNGKEKRGKYGDVEDAKDVFNEEATDEMKEAEKKQNVEVNEDVDDEQEDDQVEQDDIQ
ncbi:Hypothetical protein PHPALM_14430 [Phytophthora palmivora]|uniref:Uncharacterized protein n=1 Tax=Phytophthora palmivora TaxID=4796 RepID=A0A2P4XUR9_9STRA|nr:Hypothetical protein PHPALM_14430 [Phytophthora palmivora]